ncbi:MAG: hypothetical protein R2704_16080 [Microthrixaceae bacterium]
MSSLTFRIDAVSTQSLLAVGFLRDRAFDSNSQRLDLAERLVLPEVLDVEGTGEAARYLFERSTMWRPLVEEPGFPGGLRDGGRACNTPSPAFKGGAADTRTSCWDNLVNRRSAPTDRHASRGGWRTAVPGAADAIGDDLDGLAGTADQRRDLDPAAVRRSPRWTRCR